MIHMLRDIIKYTLYVLYIEKTFFFIDNQLFIYKKNNIYGFYTVLYLNFRF